MKSAILGLACVLASVGMVENVAGQTERSGVGVRLAAGTDITFSGVALGGELNYTRLFGPNALELGLVGLGAQVKEEEVSAAGCCSYFEQTDVWVVAALVNYLFSYTPSGPYLAAGLGVGGLSVEWREESPDDTSLGPPLPGGGSVDEADGAVGALVTNFGIGQRFAERFDLRVQVPTFFIASEVGGATSVVPTLMAGLGVRF